MLRLDGGVKPLPALEETYIKLLAWLLLPSKQINRALGTFRVGHASSRDQSCRSTTSMWAEAGKYSSADEALLAYTPSSTAESLSHASSS